MRGVSDETDALDGRKNTLQTEVSKEQVGHGAVGCYPVAGILKPASRSVVFAW